MAVNEDIVEYNVNQVDQLILMCGYYNITLASANTNSFISLNEFYSWLFSFDTKLLEDKSFV